MGNPTWAACGALAHGVPAPGVVYSRPVRLPSMASRLELPSAPGQPAGALAASPCLRRAPFLAVPWTSHVRVRWPRCDASAICYGQVVNRTCVVLVEICCSSLSG